MFIRACVQSTHVYIYAERRDEIWTNCFFPWTYLFFRKIQAEGMIVKLRTWIEIESELHRPSIKGTKLLIVIKAIVISTVYKRCGTVYTSIIDSIWTFPYCELRCVSVHVDFYRINLKRFDLSKRSFGTSNVVVVIHTKLSCLLLYWFSKSTQFVVTRDLQSTRQICGYRFWSLVSMIPFPTLCHTNKTSMYHWQYSIDDLCDLLRTAHHCNTLQHTRYRKRYTLSNLWFIEISDYLILYFVHVDWRRYHVSPHQIETPNRWIFMYRYTSVCLCRLTHVCIVFCTHGLTQIPRPPTRKWDAKSVDKYAYICICVYVWMYICMHVHLYIYKYMYIYIHVRV